MKNVMAFIEDQLHKVLISFLLVTALIFCTIQLNARNTYVNYKKDHVELSMECLKTYDTAPASNNIIIARAFWWGFHFEIPKPVMDELRKSTDVVGTVMALGGAAIAMSGGVLAPVVGFVAAYIALQFELMKLVDQGKGVYLSASWLTPNILIPTPITE